MEVIKEKIPCNDASAAVPVTPHLPQSLIHLGHAPPRFSLALPCARRLASLGGWWNGIHERLTFDPGVGYGQALRHWRQKHAIVVMAGCATVQEARVISSETFLGSDLSSFALGESRPMTD